MLATKSGTSLTEWRFQELRGRLPGLHVRCAAPPVQPSCIALRLCLLGCRLTVGARTVVSADDGGALDIGGNVKSSLNPRAGLKNLAGSAPLSAEEKQCTLKRDKLSCCTLKTCAWTGHGSAGKCGTLRTARKCTSSTHRSLILRDISERLLVITGNEHWVNQCNAPNKNVGANAQMAPKTMGAMTGNTGLGVPAPRKPTTAGIVQKATPTQHVPPHVVRLSLSLSLSLNCGQQWLL